MQLPARQIKRDVGQVVIQFDKRRVGRRRVIHDFIDELNGKDSMTNDDLQQQQQQGSLSGDMSLMPDIDSSEISTVVSPAAAAAAQHRHQRHDKQTTIRIQCSLISLTSLRNKLIKG